MPPQWNPYDEIPSPTHGGNPLIADRSPLDDILGNNIPSPPQAQQQVQPGIPTGLISMVPDVPAPPPAVGQPLPLPPMTGEIPAPPVRTSKPEPLRSLNDIPSPGPLPADLAPNFTAVDYARALDVVEAPSSVDVAGSTQRAQTAEKNLETFTRSLGDTQREAVSAAERAQTLERQAATLDQQIGALKGIKKPTPEQKEQLSALTTQRQTIAGEVKAAGAAVQDALGRFTTVRDQQAVAQQDAEQSRQQATTDVATMELEAERRGAAAQVAGAALFAQESKRIEDDAKAQTSKLQAQETAARARMDEDRKAYREALKAGPAKTSMVLTVASVIAEAMAARQSGRPPDFGRVIGQLEQSTKAQFDERVQRQLALIAEGEDSLSKAAQERRVIDGQKAARLSETLRSIEMEIETKKLKARGTVEEARLAMVQGDVRKMIEQSDAAALAAYRKTLAADEQAELDRKLKEAQLRKTNAEAAEKEGEAARKAGSGGTVKPVATAWSAREPTKVYIPYLDTELASFEGQPNAEKRAEKTGTMVTDSFRYLQTLQEYEAMLEDYGSRKLMDKSGWTESDEYRELATQHAQLKNALAKVIAGQGFSTTESDMKAADSMVPLPSAWNDKSQVAVSRMRKNGENQLRLTLSQSLDTKAQERLIKEARRWGTSKTDLRTKAVSEAPDILTDASKPVEARLAAIGALSERVRKDNSAEGEQGERDAILAELQVLKNARARILETEYDPDDPVGGVTDDAFEVGKAIRERENALRALYRKVGADNSTKREKARAADAVRSGEFYGRSKM